MAIVVTDPAVEKNQLEIMLETRIKGDFHYPYDKVKTLSEMIFIDFLNNNNIPSERVGDCQEAYSLGSETEKTQSSPSVSQMNSLKEDIHTLRRCLGNIKEAIKPENVNDIWFEDETTLGEYIDILLSSIDS
jgi:hypothetical protein